MRPTLATLLFLHLQLSFALGLQTGPILPRIINHVSASIFSHGAYVDQKVRKFPRSFPDHEQWHQRHVVPFMNASSATGMTVSSPTGSLSVKSLGSSLSSASASANSSSIASLISARSSASVSATPLSTTGMFRPLSSGSATALQTTSLASLLGSTEDLETDTLAEWDDQTESACNTALIALNGIATNPSGIAACYNIPSLDNSTGRFGVDLRLYRVAAPRDAWVQLDPSSVGVGLSYVNATVSATKARRVERENPTVPWFPAQRDEAADMYIRRSTGIPPRRLEIMTFVGTVDHGPLAELKNITTALPLLTPAITLSGSDQDGTPIDTRLSTEDASFVNGVFAHLGTGGSDMLGPASTFILPGTTLIGFPVGLIISTVWAVLYLMVMGYGTMSRYQARESYRRRVKNRFSGDSITKRTMRWA